MKEKIKNDYAIKNGFDNWEDLLCNALPSFVRYAINEVMEQLVDAEVERRIAERMPRIDYKSWFMANCRRQRKVGAKICQCCPFRDEIERQERPRLINNSQSAECEFYETEGRCLVGCMTDSCVHHPNNR